MRIDLVYPEIDPKHIESEDAVRWFHDAFYSMVVDRYGGARARQLLQMPPLEKAKMRRHANAQLLYDWWQSGLTLTEFAKKTEPNNPEGVTRSMRNWLKDKETVKYVHGIEAFWSSM